MFSCCGGASKRPPSASPSGKIQPLSDKPAASAPDGMPSSLPYGPTPPLAVPATIPTSPDQPQPVTAGPQANDDLSTDLATHEAPSSPQQPPNPGQTPTTTLATAPTQLLSTTSATLKPQTPIVRQGTPSPRPPFASLFAKHGGGGAAAPSMPPSQQSTILDQVEQRQTQPITRFVVSTRPEDASIAEEGDGELADSDNHGDSDAAAAAATVAAAVALPRKSHASTSSVSTNPPSSSPRLDSIASAPTSVALVSAASSSAASLSATAVAASGARYPRESRRGGGDDGVGDEEEDDEDDDGDDEGNSHGGPPRVVKNAFGETAGASNAAPTAAGGVRSFLQRSILGKGKSGGGGGDVFVVRPEVAAAGRSGGGGDGGVADGANNSVRDSIGSAELYPESVFDDEGDGARRASTAPLVFREGGTVTVAGGPVKLTSSSGGITVPKDVPMNVHPFGLDGDEYEEGEEDD